MSNEKKPTPPTAKDGKEPAAPIVKECPNRKAVTLVEFVEIVTRDKPGVVEKPGPASGKLATVVTRAAVEGGKYQQFINLDKDLEGAAKRQPANDRYIEVRARVEGDVLFGHTVHFSYTVTKGTKRPAVLKGMEKEGFGSAGGTEKTTATTDPEGWTDTVKFYLSQYGGDEFTLSAQADQCDAGKPTGAILKLVGYQTWRRFWYQKTHATGFNPPAMTVSEAAYKKVFALMELDNDLAFDKASTPANTFYPEWKAKVGGGDSDVALLGGHNRSHFYGLFVAKPEKPVKAHLIIAEYQWDPGGETPLQSFDLSTRESSELKLTGVKWNSAIIDPPLQGVLLVNGTWESLAPSGHADHGKKGDISAADIQILKTRTALEAFKVKLPVSASDPKVHPVKVKLKFNYARYWGGESNGYQILITYKNIMSTYNMCVSHELGHSIYQVPKDGNQAKKPLSLPDHPTFYTDDKGGQGPHCSDGSTIVKDADTTSGKRVKDGTCIMYHQLFTVCSQVFCSNCEPYLRLQEMTQLKQPT